MSNNNYIIRLTGEFQELTTGEFKTSARYNAAKEQIILAQDDVKEQCGVDVLILSKEQAAQLMLCICNTLYGNSVTTKE